MIELKLDFQGVEVIKEALDQLPGAVEGSLKEAADTVRDLVIGRTPYLTGHLQQSWSTLQPSGGGFSFGTPAPYASTLEEGKYKSVGPGTAAFEGGIYSKKAQGGIIGPIIEDENVLRQLLDLVVEQLSKKLGV